MAKCDYCGKGVTFGIKVSHSHRRSNRTWKPNVKRVKAVGNGTPCHVYACTRCLRSNKVERAVGFFPATNNATDHGGVFCLLISCGHLPITVSLRGGATPRRGNLQVQPNNYICT